MEIQALSYTTSENVVTALKAMFSRHGIPTTLVSDNGPQYIAEDMKVFAKSMVFNRLQIIHTIQSLMGKLRGL